MKWLCGVLSLVLCVAVLSCFPANSFGGVRYNNHGRVGVFGQRHVSRARGKSCAGGVGFGVRAKRIRGSGCPGGICPAN